MNKKKDLKKSDKIAIFFVTGFYSGFFPFFPGTVGSGVGLLIYLLLILSSNHIVYTAGSIVLFVLGWIFIKPAEIYFNRKDPGQIVIDEIVGFLIAMFLIPVSIEAVVAGFLLFRIFDILKPFPINRLEKLDGAKGVMLDDILAGVYVNVLFRIYFLLN